MVSSLRENQFVGCGEFVGMVIWEIETHLFGNSGDTISTVCQGEKL
jgi:hypothetical protein